MKSAAQFEYRASSSRSKHEGESSFALCDRLGRTRDNSQRQLPTDQDYAVSTREYQTDQSSLKSAPTAARSVLEKQRKQRQQQKKPLDSQRLTRSLHIRAMHSSADMPPPCSAMCRTRHEMLIGAHRLSISMRVNCDLASLEFTALLSSQRPHWV
jgi:hypothetical protein